MFETIYVHLDIFWIPYMEHTSVCLFARTWILLSVWAPKSELFYTYVPNAPLTCAPAESLLNINIHRLRLFGHGGRAKSNQSVERLPPCQLWGPVEIILAGPPARHEIYDTVPNLRPLRRGVRGTSLPTAGAVSTAVVYEYVITTNSSCDHILLTEANRRPQIRKGGIRAGTYAWIRMNIHVGMLAYRVYRVKLQPRDRRRHTRRKNSVRLASSLWFPLNQAKLNSVNHYSVFLSLLQ